MNRSRWFPALPALALAAMLAGCAAPTRYQKQEGGEGYHDYEVRPGVHHVSFIGSPGTSRGLVERHWHRRAAEICGGRGRYVILAKDPDGITVMEPTPNLLWPQTYPRVESLIRCK